MSREASEPYLVRVERDFFGATPEEALLRFEEAASEEDPAGLPEIVERLERADGLFVRYRVSYKISIFDDHPYGVYDAQALIGPSPKGFHILAAAPHPKRR
jgi:hypothetical protein